MVTDAMVEAGCKAHFVWYDGEATSLRQKELAQNQVRNILEAALSTDAEPVKTAPAVAVKAEFFEVEEIREQKLATIAAPDNGTTSEVLAAVLECAEAWVPEARIIGNVRAGDIARVVRSALSAQVQDAEGWQDISTAPKNTKVIAGYKNELGNWRTVTACYHTQLEWSDEYGDHEEEYAPEVWYEESDSVDVIYPTRCVPTHWMPLPAAPAANQGEA